MNTFLCELQIVCMTVPTRWFNKTGNEVNELNGFLEVSFSACFTFRGSNRRRWKCILMFCGKLQCFGGLQRCKHWGLPLNLNSVEGGSKVWLKKKSLIFNVNLLNFLQNFSGLLWFNQSRYHWVYNFTSIWWNERAKISRVTFSQASSHIRLSPIHIANLYWLVDSMPSNFISFLISKHSNNVKIVLIPISVLLNFLRFSVRISQIYSLIKSPIILHGKCWTTQFRCSCNLRLSSLHWREPRNLQLNKKMFRCNNCFCKNTI